MLTSGEARGRCCHCSEVTTLAAAANTTAAVTISDEALYMLPGRRCNTVPQNSEPATHVTSCKTRTSNSDILSHRRRSHLDSTNLVSKGPAVGLLEMRCYWKRIGERERDRGVRHSEKKKKGATCQMLKTLLVSPSNAEIVRFFILSRTQMRRTHFSIGMSCQACPSLTALTASQLLCDKMLCHGRIF